MPKEAHYCTSCGAKVGTDDRFCAMCGVTIGVSTPPDAADHAASAPLPADTHLGRQVGLAVATLLGLILIAMLLDKLNSRVPASAPSSISPSTALEAAGNAARAADNAMNAAMAAADAANNDPKESWSYSTFKDEMTDKETSVASLTSNNSIQQSFPYDGGTTLRMNVRRHPRHGTDVYFVLSSGQLLCNSYDGCSATVRFDDGAARKISMSGSSDNSSDTVFVNDAASFISKLKASKKFVISLEIYQSGAPNFTFDSAGLSWGENR